MVAAAAAHDLKNPLPNLQLFVEEVSHEKDPELRADLLRRIHENVARATERLSELSRAGQNPHDRVEQRLPGGEQFGTLLPGHRDVGVLEGDTGVLGGDRPHDAR